MVFNLDIIKLSALIVVVIGFVVGVIYLISWTK
jgi:hypothetical protein